MIPTVVIVSDFNCAATNNQLIELRSQLEKIVRVVTRSSLDGEKLYSSLAHRPFFEGVIYFDDNGAMQYCAQDKYDTALENIKQKMNEKLLSNAKDQLEDFLKKQHGPHYSDPVEDEDDLLE